MAGATLNGVSKHDLKASFCGLLLVLAAVPAVGFAADPVRLTTAHVDIKMAWQPADETNKLAILISDDDHGVLYRTNEAALVVIEAARLFLPGDFPPFGQDGDPLWVLPQTQDPALLYLGLSTEDEPAGLLPPGLFAGTLQLRLEAVDGPGHVFLWQADGFGGIDLRMNTRDGIDATDQTALIPGGHEHFNLGFTTNGVYHLVLRVEGRRVGVETNAFSLPTPVRFEVEPLPPEPGSPFRKWQETQWPGVTDPAIIGPEADPDGDRRPNRLEYAYAFDPKTPDGDGTPFVALAGSGPARVAEITYRRNQAATDAAFRLEAGPSLSGPWTPVTQVVGTEDAGTHERVTQRDAESVAAVAARFFRLVVELTSE